MAKVESCVDLKAIALIWRDNEAATRADREGWALGVVMRRMRVAELLEDPHVDILDLSVLDSVFEWERDKESTKRSSQFDPDARVRITPLTRIVTLSRRHKVAFVVDVSASMRVVDSSEEGLNRILVPLCFETLCNCLDGMSRPFSITNSWTGQTTEIFPEVHVTVLAKAGASMGYRPDLSPRAHAYISRHPVHVLLQDVQVTHLNLLIVAETLYMSLNAYENEMIELRHMDDRHGMHLQNEAHDPSAPATHQPQHSDPLDHSNHDPSKNPVLAAGPQTVNNEPPPLNTLEHGLLALRLLPADCSPVLIALTDGVSMSLMKGEFVYRDVCRRLSRDAVQVSIIQVGSNRGFYPSVNFGYVPDNEALRFIAFATFGKLLYASDCKYLDPIVSEDNQYPTPLTACVPTSATSSDSFSSVPASYNPPPNFYHRHLIMRDVHLAKQKSDAPKFQERHVVGPPRPVDTPRVRRINTDIFTASSEETSGSAELDFISLQRTREAKFPWNAASAPPIVAEILCGCSDYNVEASDLAILINARLLEGFSMKSIQIGRTSNEVSNAAVTPTVSTNKRVSQQKQSTRKQASGSVEFAGLAGENGGDKLEIILMRPWLPSVIIQYTIKARISLDAQRAEKSILLCVLDKKKPRIELNILAHHTFALWFVNSSEGKPKNDRFGKLAMYLKGIREADSLLHLLASFNQKPVLCSIPKFDARLFPTSHNGSSVWNLGNQPMHSLSSGSTANSAADSANLWNVFCHFMINKSASFDDCDVDIILRSSNPNRVLSDVSPQSYPPSIFSNNSSRGVHARWSLSNRDSRSRLPSALIHIMNYLANEWSLFALNRTTFVKLFHSSDAEAATSPNSAAAAASGLVVLRMVHETDWLLSMRLTFFNVPLQDRLLMKSGLCQALSLMRVPCTLSKSEAANPGTVYSPLRICEKPIRRMMVRYRFIIENEGVDHAADIGTSTDDVADERLVLHQNHDDTLNPTVNQTTAKSERTLKYATLISPVGPRSYLRSHRWIWLADVNVLETPVINRSTLGQSMVSLKSADGGSASGSHLVSILDMALYLLYFARLEEGFLLLSHLQDSVTMYREISMEKPIQCLDGQGNEMNVDEHGEIPMRRVTCGVQYIILIDRLERTVVTELWAEPVLEGDGNAVAGMNSNQDVKILFREMHDPLAKLIMESDSKLFEGLYTFERVHLIGRQGSDIPMDVTERSRGSTRRENLRSRATSVHSQRQGAVDEQTARLTSVELNEPGRKLSVMRTKYSIDAILRKSKVSCIVYAAPTVAEIPAGVGVGLISDDQPLNQMFQFKSDGNLAASRNTSPGQALDSPRPCASTDHVSFYRRSSQATGINGGKQHMNASNVMLSIGLSWDVMGNTSSPQALIRVLLLKFFQNAMAFVTDSEIAFPPTYSARKSGRTNSVIYDGLGNVAAENLKELDFNTLEQLKEQVSAAFNNQVLMSRLDESVCFVKVRSPEQFVLVFLPRAATDAFHGSHLSITLLECSRARVHDTMSGKERLSSFGFDHCKDDHSEGHTKWSVKMKNLNEAANGSILVQSEVANDSRASEKEMGFEVNPNEYIDLFVSTVSDAYAIAHCKSVYAALVQSVGVSSHDVEKALFNCFEKTIDIDLTAYLNAITLTYQRMHSSRIRAERNRIVNSFQHIMSNKFRQLLTYAGNENGYFYNPDDSDEGATQMRIESADTPLFLKTEVIFKKVVGSQVETAVVPMTFFPTSYWVPVTEVEERHCYGSGAIDFRPLSIGNKENPLASNDGTVATLRISCLSLFQPKKLYGNNDDTFDNEIFERALDDPRLILSLEKIDAFYDTVDQIKALIENEVMNALLDLPSAHEQFSMDYIRYCLSSRHQIPSKFSDREALQQFILSSTGVFDLPLEFVKNQHDTKHIMGEFSKIQIPNAMLSFTQLNEFFCITGNFQAAVNPKKHSFVRETFAENQQGIEKTMPGLRGLGISFPESESHDVSQFRFCRKSWALVSFKADLARIWFVSRFTSEAEKLDLLSWIYDAIQDTCVAVNRLILLDLLKKTHRASKFLIKRAENDDSSDEDDEDEEHHYYTAHSFVPGQFACPLVSSHTFPIHWRLKPLNALSIATASINILGISNRNNMFVFEEDGKVVYFKLSVKEVELDQSQVAIEVNHPASDDVASSSEPLMMAKGSPKTSSPLITRKPVGLGSAHSVAPQKPAESVILLEFFGVDGSLNANEFVTIIETKLGGLVQKEIGTYISRNSATVRLTPADVEFILPVTKRPQRVECFKLPDFVLDKLGFMLLFKQALSAAFNALPSLEIGSALKARFEREYGISGQAQGDRMDEINFGEFAFFYNSVQSRSNSPFEVSVGNGTALISIFVVNSKRNICQRFSHPTFAIAGNQETIWERNTHDYLRDHASELRIGDFDRCIHDDCNYAMAVEIWHYGALNSDVLMDYVFKSFCNTISDYSTESSVRSLSETLKSNSLSQLPQLEISKASVDEPFKIHSALNIFFDQTMTHLALSAELKNAAVQELCSPIRLPRCIADEIASDTRDLLTEISSSFNPVLVERAHGPSGEPSLTLYSAKVSGSEESFQNRQILLVVGIPELSDLYGCDAEGKITPKSTTSSGSRTPTSTMHDMESSFTGAAHKNSISSRAGVSQNPFDLRRSVVDGVQVYPRNLMLAGKEICSRSGFLMMLIDQSQISTATYNLNQAAYETIFNHLLQILSWNNIRMQFLESGRRGDSFGITPREKVDNLGVSAGIEHSSSYTGIGGLGHTAMSHFVANGMSETSHVDKLKRLYNINENSLQRSAVAFLDSYVRSLSLDGRNHSPAEQWVEGIDTPRSSLVQANGSGDGGKLSTADLAALLRSIRLFFVHYPIFFSDLRTSMFKDDVNPPHNEDFSNASSTPIQQWFKETLVKFSGEYSNYLASLGFEPFKTPSSQTGDWEKPPTFYISNSATVEIDAVYLMKRITSGILFVQIGVEGVCIAVNLFMLKLPSNHMDPFHEGMRYVAESDADASFKHDCAINKEALHVHSFSYDFHIRYFQHILDNQQNCIIDILDVMKVFEKYNSDRFVYARSRILGGECISDDPAPSISLFQYILKNPHQYGFKSIAHNGHPTACYLTSEFQDFAKSASKSQFKSTGLSYTVVVYVSREQSAEGASGSAETTLQLRYFLLIVDQENAFPLQGLEVKNQSFVKQTHQEKLKEYLAGGCYFGDVAKFAEKKILTLMEQATRYYDRDSLWRQLHVNKHPIPLPGDFADANETAYEWSKMLLEKIARNSRTLLLIDPSLVNIFGDATLPWLDIIKFLETTYYMTARRIFEEPSVGRQHLILFNPRDSDYMIHIMYWKVSPTGFPMYSMDDRGTDAGNLNHLGDSSGVSTPGLFSDDEGKLSIKERLRVLEETVGVELARPGEYQVDVMLVSREGVTHDGEYVQCNEIVNAISCWLWNAQRV